MEPALFMSMFKGCLYVLNYGWEKLYSYIQIYVYICLYIPDYMIRVVFLNIQIPGSQRISPMYI
jgi:hypothetical protein